MKSLANYKKIRPVGHREIADLFDGEVVVQEKIDGSNFSFGVLDGQLRCASRTQDLDMHKPDGQLSRELSAKHCAALVDLFFPR